MTITATQLRTDFPEFTDTTKYPDATVNFWLGVAVLTLPADRWDTLLDFGTELYTAHHLVVSAQAVEDAETGTPGEATGPTTSKSVDKVSVGYDTASLALENGAFYNLSTYGIQFLQLARMIGSGGIQLGGY